MKNLRGWIFDSHAARHGVRLWVLDERGLCHELLDPWRPVVRVAARGDAGRRAETLLRARLGRPPEKSARAELFSGELTEVWEARLPPREQVKLTAELKDLGCELYDADINPLQAWHYERGHFPLAFGDFSVSEGVLRGGELHDDRWAVDYPLPHLKTMRLRLSGSEIAGKMDPNHAPRGSLLVETENGLSELEGPLDLQLETLARRLTEEDPDVLETEWGDSWLLPALTGAAERCKIPLPLSRDPAQRLKARDSRTFYTYGRAVYQNGSIYLRGRWHLDVRNSFMLKECGRDGLFEVARLGALPIQRAARSTIGTALSSMQMLEAMRSGILIPSAKAQTEDFRGADEFLAADKGGLAYEAEVGWHGEVVEYDFASMYPALMVQHNISPETVNCPCCPEERVPETGHHLCRRRPGLVPRVLAPLLKKRAAYKALAKSSHPDRASYKARASAHKWILVCCFEGDARFSIRDDGHEKTVAIADLIDPLLSERDSIADAPPNIEVRGVDSSYRARWRGVQRVIRLPAPEHVLEIRAGDKLVSVTPDHTCFILHEKLLAERPADALRPGDLVPILRQDAGTFFFSDLWPNTDLVFARIESVTPRPPRTSSVYCFELDVEPRLLGPEGGLLTSNCFGYLGYSNARFGKIEAHECVTAWGRETLLRAKDAAEGAGFKMLHALVDSVWLEGKPGTDYEALRRLIEEGSGVSLALEGVYKWLRFCPSKEDPRAGVPARYFGAFQDGEMKARGLAYRRRDTPLLIKNMQVDMLALLAKSADLSAAKALLPDLHRIAAGYRSRLRAGQASAEELAVTVHLSRDPSKYKVDTHSAIAAKALMRAGLTLHPGETLRYVISSAKDPVKDWRVTPLALMEGALEYDPVKYLELLDRAVKEIVDGLDAGPEQLRLF